MLRRVLRCVHVRKWCKIVEGCRQHFDRHFKASHWSQSTAKQQNKNINYNPALQTQKPFREPIERWSSDRHAWWMDGWLVGSLFSWLTMKTCTEGPFSHSALIAMLAGHQTQLAMDPNIGFAIGVVDKGNGRGVLYQYQRRSSLMALSVVGWFVGYWRVR